MTFLLKKTIASLLLPLPISLLLLIIGLCILLISHARKTAAVFVSLGITTLIIFSINPISSDLLLGLEKDYHPMVQISHHARYIVVLGGGNGGSRHYPPNTQLSSASLARLVEGIRLYRQNPETILLLSGGRVFGSRADATVMNNTALALGVQRSHVIIEAGSRDTQEEAKHLKPLLKEQTFVLVTSAYHMPRAMMIFHQLNMHPIPAPTQFLTKRYRYNLKYYFPSVVNLIHSDIALHEYMGILWGKIVNLFKNNNAKK